MSMQRIFKVNERFCFAILRKRKKKKFHFKKFAKKLSNFHNNIVLLKFDNLIQKSQILSFFEFGPQSNTFFHIYIKSICYHNLNKYFNQYFILTKHCLFNSRVRFCLIKGNKIFCLFLNKVYLCEIFFYFQSKYLKNICLKRVFTFIQLRSVIGNIMVQSCVYKQRMFE